MANCYSLLAMSKSITVATHYLDRPDGRIAYDVRGDVGSPVVLLVPGMGDPRSTFRFQVEPLAAAGFRVVTMDLRGHGESDVTFTEYDDEALAGDVTALVGHLGGPATVVGNSMGAGAAVIAAAGRPDLVSRLVLIGAFVRDPALNPVVSALFRVVTLRPWVRTVWRAYLPSLYAGAKPTDFAAYRDAVHADLGKPGHAPRLQRHHPDHPCPGRGRRLAGHGADLGGHGRPRSRLPRPRRRGPVDHRDPRRPRAVGHGRGRGSLARTASTPTGSTSSCWTSSVPRSGAQHRLGRARRRRPGGRGRPRRVDAVAAGAAPRSPAAQPVQARPGSPGPTTRRWPCWPRRSWPRCWAKPWPGGPAGTRSHALALAYHDWAVSRPGRYAATQRAPRAGDTTDEGASAAVMRVVADALRGYDLDEDTLVDATRTLRAIVHGFVALEQIGGFGMARHIDASLAFALDSLESALDPAGARAPE